MRLTMANRSYVWVKWDGVLNYEPHKSYECDPDAVEEVFKLTDSGNKAYIGEDFITAFNRKIMQHNLDRSS